MKYTYFRKPSFFSTKRISTFVLIVLLSGFALTISIKAETKSAYAASDALIMGGPKVSAAQMAAYYRYKQSREFPNRPYRSTVTLDQLAQLFIEEGLAEGVRGDIAFAQSIHETMWFHYPVAEDNGQYGTTIKGQVRWTDNNFAGIGACNSCANGFYFPDARTGVRAQIQLLRNYADPTSRISNLAYPPVRGGFDTFVYKGAAPTWEGLNGKWAVPGSTYGQSIISTYSAMASFSGVTPDCPPDAQPKTQQVSGKGYWTVSPDGAVYSFGGASYYGGMNGSRLNGSILGMAPTVSGKGYWMVGSDGGIFSFGDAQFFGSTGSYRLNKPIVGMAPTPSGNGYWLVATDGGIFTFGDAQFYGSTGSYKLNQPIVGMSTTPTGRGYWLVATDGGIFAFGDAEFYGSTGSYNLNKPIVGMSARPQGNGYWLIASDGGIFTFGASQFFGSLGSCAGREARMIQTSPSGNGYLIVTGDGRVTSFGDAKHFGYQSRDITSMAAIK